MNEVQDHSDICNAIENLRTDLIWDWQEYQEHRKSNLRRLAAFLAQIDMAKLPHEIGGLRLHAGWLSDDDYPKATDAHLSELVNILEQLLEMLGGVSDE